MAPKSTQILPLERITSHILLLRGEKVLFDFDLAELYGVETKVLLQQVRRNGERFPEDFRFQLTREEFTSLRSQFVTSKADRRGGRQYRPYAFTEQGVAMLSSVLRSPRAVQVNIAIMRAFVQLRQMISSHTELARKFAALERKYDAQFKVVFDAIRALMSDDHSAASKPTRRIGFGT